MRTFCLTVPEAKWREEEAKKHFAERGVNAEFVTCINAKAAGLRTINNYEVDDPGSGFNIGPHCVGIWIAHQIVWNVALYQPEEHFLILEIDAQFEPDWKERLDQAMKDVPNDFDWLFVGSCCASMKPSEHIKGEIYEVKYPYCFHAYVVAKKCLPILLNGIRKCWAPIDLQLPSEVFGDLKVYTILPRPVHQFNTKIDP